MFLLILAILILASIRRFLNSIESSLVVEENLNDVKILFILFYVCCRFQKTFLKIRFMIGSVLSRIFNILAMFTNY